MKTITRQIDLYSYQELSPKAKKRALSDWNEHNDMPFLQSMLNDECGQLLKEHGIKCTSNHPVCLYSLSYCQGDGLMFEGSFTWKGQDVQIRHSGHYYHAFSKEIDAPSLSEREYAEFDTIYVVICKKLEKYGYQIIEDETSEAHFIDECNENEWTFTSDGKMDNE